MLSKKLIQNIHNRSEPGEVEPGKIDSRIEIAIRKANVDDLFPNEYNKSPLKAAIDEKDARTVNRLLNKEGVTIRHLHMGASDPKLYPCLIHAKEVGDKEIIDIISKRIRQFLQSWNLETSEQIEPPTPKDGTTKKIGGRN